MAPRVTRSSTSDKKTTAEPAQLSSPPETPAPTTKHQLRAKKAASSEKVKPIKKEPISASKKAPQIPTNKRKRTSAESEDNDDGEEKIFDELPHNLGPIATPEASDETSDVKTEQSPPPKKKARRTAKSKSTKVKDEAEVAEVKDELEVAEDKTDLVATPKSASPGKGKAKAKKNKYGFMPGESPYPDYPHPTSEECFEVNRILSKEHGTVKAPEVIPVPSVDVAGCGEVPSVLDALIRTRLSAATSGANSSRAFQGLVKKYGIITEGIGKGSVNWNKVRLSSQSDVFEAIKSGGLADVKSKDIKAILEITHKENQARRAALQKEAKDDKASGPAGSESEPAETKKAEIAMAESEVLSLDHYHVMETQEALDQMVTFPGIGPKTAACVALFCLRRSCFAVDTHVFRLVQYLGWVPSPEDVKPGQPKVTRNTAYTHCEARVPDELKYSLHQLLIKHGKVCPRCRAATSASSEAWAEGCPLEHLVKRYGAKKGGTVVVAPKRSPKNGEKVAKSALKKTSKAAPKKKPGRKAKKAEESEEEEEISDLSDPNEVSDLSDLSSESEFDSGSE